MGKKQVSSNKRPAALRDRSAEVKPQNRANRNVSEALITGESSGLLALAVGAGLSATMLMPTDSISGSMGQGLPLVAYWLLVPFLLTWLVAKQAFLTEGPAQAMLQRTAIVATYAWAPVLIWVATVVIVRWDQGNNRSSLNMFWQYVGAAFCSVVLTVYASSGSRRRGLLQLFLFLCFGLAIHGLHQYWISMPADRKEFELDPVTMMRMAGIDASIGSQEYQQFKNRVESTEPFATFALANSLAVVLGVATVLGFGMAVGDWLRKRSIRLVSAWLLLTFVIGCVLILTKSRAAWIGAAIGMGGLIASLIWSRRELRPAMIWISGLGIAGLSVLGWIGYRQDPLVVLEATKSFQYRVEYWIATSHMIFDHWLLGVGPGQYQSHYTWYKLPQASETVADPHNWIMEILATTGLGGLIAWCMCVGIIYRWRIKVGKIHQAALGGDREKVQEASSRGEPANSRVLGAEKKPNHVMIWDGNDSTASQRWLYAGAYLGVVLTIFLGLPLGFFPDVDPLFWSLLGTSLLGAWILWEQGLPDLTGADLTGADLTGAANQAGERPTGEAVLPELQRSIVFWPSVVWGVALLAAGGWMVPGVCLPLWILVAIWIGVANESLQANQRSILPLKRPWWIGLQIGKIAIFALFLGSAWNPVMKLLPVLNTLNFGGQSNVTTLQNAIRLDPLDPRPRQYWARYWLEKGLAGSSTDRQKALEAIELWIQHDPANSALYRNAGDWVWLLAKSVPANSSGEVDEDLLKLATRYYREAERRYPNDAGIVLQLAAIQEVSGAHESAKGLAERAVQIDQSHSHLDRKLQIQRIWWPGFAGRDSTIGGQAGDPYFVPATEVLQRIVPSTR